MRTVTRPVLRWHGGKWILAPWIVQHLPDHRIYVEEYGGAASVLMQKRRSYSEVYNDLDDDVVGMFRVLRDTPDTLIDAIRLTPYARREFELSYQPTDDPVERARRLMVRSFMGFGSDSIARNATGFRPNSNRSGTTPAHDWHHYATHLERVVERMRGVVIEHRPALEVMRVHDGPQTLHYLDPPYMHSTRGDRHRYLHEMTDDDHVELLERAQGVQGMVVISGYRCELYDTALAGWECVTKAALADGARPRQEALWINARAMLNLQRTFDW